MTGSAAPTHRCSNPCALCDDPHGSVFLPAPTGPCGISLSADDRHAVRCVTERSEAMKDKGRTSEREYQDRQRDHAFRAGGLEPRQGRTGDPRTSGAQPVPIGKTVSQGKARNTGMGVSDFPAWWAQLQALANPIRRELHLFMLLSGLRRTDVLTARWVNFDDRPAVAPLAVAKRRRRARVRTTALDCDDGLPGARQGSRANLLSRTKARFGFSRRPAAMSQR